MSQLDLGPMTLNDRERQLAATALTRWAEEMVERLFSGTMDDTAALSVATLNMEVLDLAARLNGTEQSEAFRTARRQAEVLWRGLAHGVAQ